MWLQKTKPFITVKDTVKERTQLGQSGKIKNVNWWAFPGAHLASHLKCILFRNFFPLLTLLYILIASFFGFTLPRWGARQSVFYSSATQVLGGEEVNRGDGEEEDQPIKTFTILTDVNSLAKNYRTVTLTNGIEIEGKYFLVTQFFMAWSYLKIKIRYGLAKDRKWKILSDYFGFGVNKYFLNIKEWKLSE